MYYLFPKPFFQQKKERFLPPLFSHLGALSFLSIMSIFKDCVEWNSQMCQHDSGWQVSTCPHTWCMCEAECISLFYSNNASTSWLEMKEIISQNVGKFYWKLIINLPSSRLNPKTSFLIYLKGSNLLKMHQ